MADAKKTTTNNGAQNKEIKELREQNAALQSQIQQMQQMMLSMQQMMATNMATAGNAASAQQNSLLDEVTLVHLVQRAPGLSTHMEISNLEIDMNAFGEQRTLDRRQAEELVGKYRRFFDAGIIAFGDGCEDIARRFGLKVVKDYKLGNDFVPKLATLDVNSLEDLYMSLGTAHRAFIIEYFKRKILEKDPRFNQPQKIEMLNRVSGGAMSGVTLDARREEEQKLMKQNK